MKSLIKQIETRFELFESIDLKQAANDPKAFVVDMYNQGKSKAEIVDALLDAGHHRDHAEGLATRDGNGKQIRWQDNDGDGIWYEPGVDVKEESVNDSIKCDRCNGKGCDHCDGKGYHEKVDEMSTTAGVPAPPHKYAFGKKKKKYSTGYSVVEEALERQYEKLIEGYRSYVTENPKLTPEKKVKNTIREVSKKMSEIEEMVKHASRLKIDAGMSKDGYGPQVERALNKISERLIKISERVRSLGE
jgi:hypothetical protein